MKRVLFLWCFVFVVLSLNNNLFSSEKYETRCGWIDNPTPANWDLTDRDRTWTIGVQGGVQAEGDIPELKRGARYWKETNGHYGYGCACLSVITDEKEGRIIKIKGGRGLLLSQCQADKSLRVRH